MANTNGGMLETAYRYRNKWRSKSNFYWWCRLCLEVIELGLSLCGCHKDSPDHELIQIGSIVINWETKLRDDQRKVEHEEAD